MKGYTERPAKKAPLRKVTREVWFVVHPSGKIRMGAALPCSLSSYLSLISCMIFSRSSCEPDLLMNRELKT